MDHVNRIVSPEAGEAAAAATFLTPLNVALLGLTLYALYALLRPAWPAAVAPQPAAAVFRTFTPRTLQPHDGRDGGPVLLAVRGRVFDVSPGRAFYGPGGPYASFAGRDASRGLAQQRFDPDVLTHDLDAALDLLNDLAPDEMDNLCGWEERFLSKYDVVGRLVAVGEE